MKTNAVLLTTLLAAGALASPAYKPGHVVHDRRDIRHPAWVKKSALAGETRVPLRIALKQRNLEEGGKLLFEVSDPDSEKYGQYMSQDEISDFFAPDSESIETVTKWLKAEGVPASHITVSKSKGFIKADVTASQLSDLLKTSYHTYTHVESRNEHIGTDTYHLPRDVSQVVDFISPSTVFAPTANQVGNQRRTDKAIGGNKFKPLPKDFGNANAAEDCGTQITPSCIKKMYQIPDATLNDKSNSLGIFEIDSEMYNQADLDLFYKTVGVDIPAGTAPKANLIDGAKSATTSQSGAGGEITLDLDIAIPLIYPQSTTLFQTVVQKDDIFNTFLDAVDGSYCTFEGGDDPDVDGVTPNEDCGKFEPTNVVSFSYGWDESSYPAKYLIRQCNEFMKLGLQGVSAVFSSGDDGVARRGGACLGPNQDIFTPNTAAACPYVTTVGSTTLPKGSQPGDEETATDQFSSGGGFSNVFVTPDYQKEAVSNYLTKQNPGYKSYKTSNGTIPTTGGIYNAAGRGYPDLAANGQNGVVVVAGKKGLSGGTSMSAPLVASIFNLINEERIKAGKKTIGFANPVLYKNPDMFTDIVKGNQDKGGPNGDSAPSACGNDGFSAVPGWDPVTGLGTPNYPKFLKAFMAA